LICSSVFAASEVTPQDNSAEISATNAKQLRPLKEMPQAANRILCGPHKGEMTVLDLYNSIKVVDDHDLRTLRTYSANHHPNDVTVSRDGKLLMWTEGGGGEYTLHQAEGEKPFKLALGPQECRAAISPDNKLLAIGQTIWFPNEEGAGESWIKLFDRSGNLLRSLEKFGAGYLSPVFSPDGKTLAVGNLNHETQLFEVATGKHLHTLSKRGTREIAFSPDGKTLAAGYVDGTVAVWDVANGKLQNSRASGCKQVFSLDWSPKGDLLVTGGTDWKTGKLTLWDPSNMTKLKERDVQKIFWQVRFTTDGTGLLSSSASDNTPGSDERITRWAVASEGKP
jgi:WD40 repeat protein